MSQSDKQGEDTRITEAREWLKRNPYFRDVHSIELSIGAVKAMLSAIDAARSSCAPSKEAVQIATTLTTRAPAGADIRILCREILRLAALPECTPSFNKEKS